MAQPEFTTRPATKKDIDSLWEMQLEFLEHQKVEEYRIQTKEGALRDLFGSDPAARALICELKNSSAAVEYVGYILYFHAYSTGKGKRLHVENLFIREKYRSHGFGKEILQELMKISQNSGARIISLECMTWNERAIKFFKSFGFAQDPTIGFKLPLKDLQTFFDASNDSGE